MVTKYISLDDAIKLLRKAETGYRNRMVSQVRADMIAHCIKLICELPAADVRPVVRGEWKKAYGDHEAFGVRPFYRYCSKCHEASVHQYNFCPNCGADMREETDG